MNKLCNSIIVVLLALSVGYSLVQVALNVQGEVVSTSSDVLWGFTCAVLIAIWATKEQSERCVHRPFEFGAFVYFAWPLVLPYYLYRTRGVEGLLVFSGFFAIYAAPFLCGLIAYVYWY